MDIRKIHTQEIDLAKLQGGKLEAVTDQTKNETPVQDLIELDTNSVENFQNLKKFVATAAQSGRAEYIQKIKEAIAAGNYDIDSDTLADSMVEDGFLEVLM